jgi:phosphoribosylanthranilate isomerase
MFAVKVCGVTSVNDALMAASAGADAVGLNFFPKSPRYVPWEMACRIARSLPQGMLRVGVFVNVPAREVCRIFEELDLGLIQIHGDEPPELLAELGGRPTMRAFRLDLGGLPPIRAYLEHCRRLGCEPSLVLLDSGGGAYGGSGTTADWSLAARYGAEIGSPPLVLAGGLRPDNVAEAIRSVRPRSVDVASGVEASPGRKQGELVEQFVIAARRAFASIGREC